MTTKTNVTVVPEGVSGKAKAKRVAKVKAPKAHEVEGFDPLKWDGVEMKEAKTYYVLRSRGEIPGVTELDVAENPVELVEARFLSYSPTSKEYAFDDGRLMKNMIYLAVSVADREHYIHVNTPAGKKAGMVFVDDWRARHVELIAAARHKDPAHTDKVALNVEALGELEVMVIAVGGTPKDLLKVGKARAKKVGVILKKREEWIAKGGAGKKPIPDRPSRPSTSRK